MHKALPLFAMLVLLTGPLAAQTAPAPAPPATSTEKSPWLIFDQPLDSIPAAKRNNHNRVEATQGANYVPLDADTYRLIDRYAIKFGPDALNDPHTSVRPYARAAAAH